MALHQIIPHTQLLAQQLPSTPIHLWLIPPVFSHERMDDEVVRRICGYGLIRRTGFFAGLLVWQWRSGFLPSLSM